MTLHLRLSFITTLLLLLIGCAPVATLTTDMGQTLSDPTDADLQAGTETSDYYLQQAELSTGEQRNSFLIQAAQLLLQEGNYESALTQLNLINRELTSPIDNNEIELVTAELFILQGQSRDALKQLSGITGRLDEFQQTRLMRLRAQAFLDAGYPFESAKTRVQMDSLISDEFESELNHQAIWEALSLLPKTSLQQASSAPLNKQFLGWIELARIAKNAQIDWQRLQDDIYRWSQAYPKHPASATFIKDLGYKQTELIEKPDHIAVLLPLSGRYAQVAAAIREGILTAYYQHPDKSFMPRISFVDTSENQAAIWNYYKQATDLGADFIIGPFLKSAVDTLSRSPQMEVPTLTLNYSSEKTEHSGHLYQFGLLPEDEAHQSAEMAIRQGRTHAAVLVPDGDWGNRLRNAFQLRFEELGGKVVSAQTYTPNSNDFKRPIQSMLNISQSYRRYQRIQSITNLNMKFIPYRRQDVDMIFMAATPKDARQLKPQFKFHYAGEIPVYSTSHAFTGQLNKQADRDIDNLNFCDMPWILNAPSIFKQSLINYWPQQQRYTRFFAMGVDAYNIIPFLGRLKGKTYERFSGQTGNLYLDQFNRIHRELLWASFEQGIPKLIDINTMPARFALDETQPDKKSIH